MKIRRKTDQELQHDRAMVRSDMQMGIISDLYGCLGGDHYASYLRQTKKLQKQRERAEHSNTLIMRICRSLESITRADQSVDTIANVLIECGPYKEKLLKHDGFSTYKKHNLVTKIIEWWTGNQKPILPYQADKLCIYLQNDQMGWDEVRLPGLDQKDLLNYLLQGKPPITFDCQSFVHQIKGMKMREHDENYKILRKKRSMYEIDETGLQTGDCIYTFNYISQDGGFYPDIWHFAYYLGNGLFLSKMGVTGSLTVCTLEDMHRAYHTKEFVCMRPNPYHEDNTRRSCAL